MAGQWLAHDAGFHAGQKLRVHIEHGKLTITAT
ncbi:type I toxin-antitoxin system SymE family toxin [Burkholderia pseudomallei]|nr:type I toxin-antitoxin system SymE family toxin [Burkholderia pseudomallei]MCW0060340.1 type I toxin-antitoxin system SymE family toxin [Burkholderia pseudomallei]